LVIHPQLPDSWIFSYNHVTQPEALESSVWVPALPTQTV
jgi:hypothetical protein